jgi:hypothetical protein
MSDEYICGKCLRVLRYSFIRNIGCLLVGGHKWAAIDRGSEPGYFGVRHETMKYGCLRCGAAKWRREWHGPLHGQRTPGTH